MATLHELDTVYGGEDVADMLEVIVVNLHNERAEAQRQKQLQQRGG